MDDAPPDLRQASKAKKKPYEAPCLETYGDVARITNSIGMMGANPDGGTGVGMMKTS
jgi:hypothetical protein